MTTTSTETGRYRQRRRTRTAIVAAATRLLQEGRTPSMTEVADAADVSRRTVYLYFPTLEQLLLDATLGALSESTVDQAGEESGPTGDPRAKAEAKLAAVAAQSAQTLPLGRSLIRMTVDAPRSETDEAPRRGFRRTGWIEQATEPFRDRLGPEAYERLVSALAVVVGWEALVVLEDVRGLDPESRHDTVTWAIRTLLAAALDGPDDLD